MGNASILLRLRALMIFIHPPPFHENEGYFGHNAGEAGFNFPVQENEENDANFPVQEYEEDEEELGRDNVQEDANNERLWFEQEIDTNVKWSLALDPVTLEVETGFQSLLVVFTQRFGKVGGGGSAAREVLKHRDIEKVIACDFDRVASECIRRNIEANIGVFNDDRLQVVYHLASLVLETSDEKFDVIIGDLPDADKWSFNIYTKFFYENIAKPKLKDGGIFVTQASDDPINLDDEELDRKIGERVRDGLRYLDGPVFVASTILNKTLKNSLMEETRILTIEMMPLELVRKPGVRRCRKD
ncbi:hypothetical protein Fmac_020679 [Flemingia macrophylla]|uniref:PABS domain-containing protein n=1 Tax=Flemingia macrophylla TaxID=520843 RepID=A0ABD1LUN5_9FABA